MSLRSDPGRQDPQVLADAWAGFLGRWRWDWFATLTFRGNPHPEAAAKRARLLISKLNRHLYGPRWHKRKQGVRWVMAFERTRRRIIHLHMLIAGEGVRLARRLSWMDEWEDLAGFARIEEPANQAAVRGYCSKYVAKGGEIDVSPGLTAALAENNQELLPLLPSRCNARERAPR